MGTDRNNEGRFTQQHTDADVVAAVRAHEPAATSEVASELGIARQSADYRLRKLRDSGRVSSKKIGASLVWFSPVDPDTEEGTNQDTDNRATGKGFIEDGSPSEERFDPLEEIDFPTGRDRADCEEAVHAVRDYLRDHGPASMREIVVQVMPAYPIGYEVPEIVDGELVADRYRGAWWRKVVKPGLTALPNVNAPVGGGKWRYTGDDRS